MRGLLLGVALAVAGCGKSSAAVPPGVHWYDLENGEIIARREHKPILLFGFAEWSTADKELDHETFPSLEVRGEMQDFIAIRVDLTDDEDEEANRAKERFAIVGVPTLIAMRSLDDYPNHASYNNDSKALFRFNEYVPPKELVPALQEAKREFRRGS